MPPVAAGFAAFWLAGKLLGDAAQPGDLATVLRGLPHNVTTEMDLELWRLATAVRADTASVEALRLETAGELADRYRDDASPTVLQRGLRAFLTRYGIRAVAEIDVGVPRWAEDPAHLLGVLGNYLRLRVPLPDVVAMQVLSFWAPPPPLQRLPEHLHLGAVGIPAPERHVRLAGPEVLDRGGAHAGGGQRSVEAGDRVRVTQPEPDVEAVRERAVHRRREQCEEEPVVVAHEVPALGLERRAEAEVPLVEVPAGCGVAHPEVQVVEVHARAGCQRPALLGGAPAGCPAVLSPGAVPMSGRQQCAARVRAHHGFHRRAGGGQPHPEDGGSGRRSRGLPRWSGDRGSDRLYARGARPPEEPTVTTTTITATPTTFGLRTVLEDDFALACSEWSDARARRHRKDTPAHRAAVAEAGARIDAVLDMYLDARPAA